MKKKCSKCEDFRDPSQFYKDKRSKSGLSSQCIPCQKIHKYSKGAPERMRTCRRCRRSRDITEFGYYEGMVRRSRVCKVCYGSEVSKIEKTQAETERIKAIMSVPIKPEATHFHYMGKNPIQREQEIGV